MGQISKQDYPYSNVLDSNNNINVNVNAIEAKRYTDPENLVISPQNVTASWENFGGQIDVKGYNRLTAWIIITHNDSLKNRVQALAIDTYDGSDLYSFPIRSTDSSVVYVQPQYYEFSANVSQKMVIDWDVSSVQYVQLQIMCDSVGTTADTIIAKITKMF